jgi:hypothetical protein
MKKILTLCIAAALFGLSANAQTEKSTILAGGSLAFQSTSGSSILVLNPNLGVFIQKNLAIGAEFTLISASSITTWSIGPYARLYFAGSDKGSFFGQAGVSIGGSGGTTATRFLGKAGYALFLNKSVALEFSAGYNAGKGADFFLLGAGFQIHLKK